MADVQDLVDRKVADRVGRDGDIWWAVVGVDSSASKPRLFLHAEGDTSLASVFDYLYDDQIQYVLFKVLGLDNRGAVTSTRCKLVLAQWLGPTVPRLKKTNAMSTKKAISEYFLVRASSRLTWRRAAGGGQRHRAWERAAPGRAAIRRPHPPTRAPPPPPPSTPRTTTPHPPIHPPHRRATTSASS